MAKRSIDLNADMGEGFGAYTIGHDEALLDIVTSANIACGFHGGDATIMQRVAMLAAKRGVGIGAHPGFNDLWGFGRRAIHMDSNHLEYMVAYQIGALMALAAYSGASVRHVKPHGALYNMAADDTSYAMAIARAVKTVCPGLILVGLPNSEMEKAAEREGLLFAKEAFCDRLYDDDGRLVGRSVPRAVLSDSAAAAAQALSIAQDGHVITASGARIAVKAETLCIHGDGTNAPEIAAAVRKVIETAGIECRKIKETP